MDSLAMRSALIGLILGLSAGCAASYAKRGDQAQATGNWVVAVEMYSKALADEPGSAELRKKYEYARGQAVRQSLATAKRCETERDMACVDRETTYVLTLDTSNDDATSMRLAARKFLALGAQEAARQQAKRGEFLAAVRAVAESKTTSTDPEVLAGAEAVSKEIAGSAVSFVQATLSEPTGNDVEQQDARYGECIEILNAVVEYAPDGLTVLAQAKARRQAIAGEMNRLRTERQAAEAEAARVQAAEAERAEADSHRTVSMVGVLAGPGKADGTQWDGMGAQVTSEVTGAIGTALAASNPAVAVASALAGPAANALEKPDVAGYADLYEDQRLVSRVQLEKKQDTFTPQWGQAQWSNVDIRKARVRVVLVDMDLTDNDDMGTAEVDSRQLAVAAETGGVYAAPVYDQTNKQILFIALSVM